MEKDTLRRHVYEEIHSQFETKLREAKRQKTQVEEELESLSEKWRSERRRLNAEIDRLEAALADAKDVRKRGGTKTGRAAETEDLLKAQQAAEEKFNKAAQQWEKEKTALQGEIKRLELGLADVLERSNNPMRSAQVLRESLEAKLEEAIRAKQRIEDEYATSKGKWERDKTHFEAEIAKLRKSMGKIRTPEEEEEHQKKLRDALNARKAIEHELAELRQKHGLEIVALQKELKQTRDLVAEARIQAEKAADEYKVLRAATADQESRSNAAVSQARAEAETVRKRLADELAKAKEQLDALAKTHAQDLAALRKTLQNQPAQPPPSAGMSDQLQEVMRHRNFLQQQLHQAEETIRVVRAEQSEEFAQLTAQLQEARVETARLRKNLERELQKAREDAEATRAGLTAEIEELKKAPTQKGSGNDPQIKADLQEIRRQNEDLKRQVRDAKDVAANLQEEHAAERNRLTQELAVLRSKAEQELSKHKEELKKTTAEIELLRQKQADKSGKQPEQPGKTQDGFAHQLREVMQQRNFLQQQVHQAEEAIRALRAEHMAEIKKLKEQLEQARGDAQHLELQLGENNETVSGEVVEQLRRQYDERIQEIIQQKTRLAEELQQASAMLETERKRFAAAAASGSNGAAASPSLDHRRIHEEVSRVEDVIQGITTLIDDPSIELSTVIRKNVERAEWDAYLKGILFSLGKTNGK